MHCSGLRRVLLPPVGGPKCRGGLADSHQQYQFESELSCPIAQSSYMHMCCAVQCILQESQEPGMNLLEPVDCQPVVTWHVCSPLYSGTGTIIVLQRALTAWRCDGQRCCAVQPAVGLLHHW
jgi:hypothetical protein